MKYLLFLILVASGYTLFIPELGAVSPLSDPLSRKTALKLKDRFGLELSQDGNGQRWIESEGVAILNLMRALPVEVGLLLERQGQSIIKVRKVPASVSIDIDDYGRRSPLETIDIPVYDPAEIHRATVDNNPGYTAREKEIVSFLFRHNLIVPSAGEPCAPTKTKPSDSTTEKPSGSKCDETGGQASRLYHLYLQRELAKRLFYVYDSVHRKSESKEWRSFSEWNHPSLFGFQIKAWMKDAENQDIRGYAHPSGLLGPREDFAAFAAGFFVAPITLYDRSIKCRTPRKYAYFKRLFPKYRPHLDHPEFSRRNIRCPRMEEEFLEGLEFRDIHTQEKIEIGPITARTVSGFELIYATPGDREISEIAGHLLLRVKLDNNPEAEALGIENPNDIVIALLADNNDHWLDDGTQKAAITRSNREECPSGQEEPVPDFSELVNGTVQALKGLSGQFRTIFQVDTLQFAVDHYTVKNNRTLERYRLNLTEERKAMLLEHLRLVKKNFKTDYYFFTKNCGSVLVKLIGEALDDRDIANYNYLAAPPNALLTLMLEKKAISPVYPHFYSFTARAQIAQDIIADTLSRLRRAFPNEPWPETRSFFDANEETRIGAYSDLVPIAMKKADTWADILYVLTVAQKAELVFTWNKGVCIGYSTKTKGRVRNLWKRLHKLAGESPSVDLKGDIERRDLDLEKADNETGSGHTGLMSWHLGAGFIDSPTNGYRNSLFLGGAIYRQNMGDASNRAMQRGTSVELGKATISLGTDETGRSEIAQWKIVGLKIRKIKARRHYIPSVFSPDRKLGLGFTVLEIGSDPWKAGTFKTTFAEGEVFTSLVSSRLFLDHLIVATGLGLETPWQNRSGFGAKFLSADTLLEFPMRLEGLLTFGSDRKLQTRAQLEYQQTYDITGHTSIEHRNEKLSLGTSFIYRLTEVKKAEILLKGGLEFQEHLGKDQTGRKSRLASAELGIQVDRW